MGCRHLLRGTASSLVDLVKYKEWACVGTFKCSAVIYYQLYRLRGFPGSAEVKASACNVGDLGLILGLGRSPGEGNGYPLQYSFFFNWRLISLQHYRGFGHALT